MAVRRWKRFKNGAIYLFVRALLWIGARIPAPVGRFAGLLLGEIAYWVVFPERRKAWAGLRTAFPDRTPAWRRSVARACFRHLGRDAFEAFRFPRLSDAEIVAMISVVEGEERLNAALARGKGVLCITGHVGNWELLAAYMAASGRSVSVVAQRLYDPRLDLLLNGAREKRGIRIHPRGGSVKDVLRSLREGRLLGLLCDQDTDVDSVHVPFFGAPARTPAGPVVLAQKTGAALLPIVIFRDADGRHRIRIGEEIAPPAPGDRTGGIRAAVGAYTRFLEEAIREHPDQWVWMHERWKTPEPVAEAPLVSLPSKPVEHLAVVLAIAALLGGAGCKAVSKGSHLTGGNTEAHKPAILIDGMHGTGTVKGVKELEYDAVHAEMSDDQKTARAQEIEVRQFRNGKMLNSLRADRGIFHLDTNDGEAFGHVVVKAESGARLETEHLRWIQGRNRFETEDAVKIIKGDNVSTGVGLVADSNLDSIEIGNVRMTLTNLEDLKAAGTPAATPVPTVSKDP